MVVSNQYRWKINGLFPVDAQTAGEELARIYDRDGRLTPKSVLDESRDESAPLHSCFEWNDSKAAEAYRLRQAGNIIRALVTVEARPQDTRPVAIRVYHSIKQEGYQPLQYIVTRPDMREEMMQNARRDLLNFRSKYLALADIEEFKPLMELISRIA